MQKRHPIWDGVFAWLRWGARETLGFDRLDFAACQRRNFALCAKSKRKSSQHGGGEAAGVFPSAPSRHRKAPLPGELSAKLTERLLQMCYKSQTANSVCGLERLTIKCQVWNVRSGKNFRRIKKGIAKQTSRRTPNWAYRRMDLRSVTIWLLGLLHRVN